MAHLVRLGSHLTDRDRQILLDCYEHHVLTTGQIGRLHFTSARKARDRLALLHTLRALDRFRPPWHRGDGSSPYHWILDEAGAHVVAELHGVERRELRWRHSTALALSQSAKLRHLLAINEFFSELATEAAGAGGTLSEWYGERTSQQLFDGSINPDGYGVLILPGHAAIHVLLELDLDTEPTGTLAQKAIRYQRALPHSALAASEPLIILAVPTRQRARAAAEAVHLATAPISVALWAGTSPLEIVLTARQELAGYRHS
jgi:hypothetical protein